MKTAIAFLASILAIATAIICVHAQTSPKESTAEIKKPTAPYGRMIKCRTVTTIDSAQYETPIIATVKEGVWSDKQLIIPEDLEVHGIAQPGSLNDKIQSNGSWTLVWRTQDKDNGKELIVKGKELTIEGTALEAAYNSKEKSWDMTDGSAGIRGYAIQEKDGKGNQITRVPAGTDFYLYVQQTIDLTQARIGATATKETQAK